MTLKKPDISALINKMGKNRNTIFLVMCLMVHISYFVTFFIIDAIPLCLINAVSSVFYILFLIFSKDRERSEKATVVSYFEIIIFAFLCEIFTRNTFGFIYFVIGMIPVVFYLCPSYGNKRFFFQIIGVISALMINLTPVLVPEAFFSQVYSKLSPYATIFNFVNLLITLFTVLYTAFFYKLELDMIRSELDYSSTHDPLTGLYNRRYLYDAIDSGTEEHISVVLLDVDNFKRVNDIFGHDIGDEVLVTLASCIRETADEKCYPVRWGGEEFIICYRDVDIEYAYKRASQLCRLISEKTILPDNTPVTVTIGLNHGKRSEFDSVLKTADKYLYIGKKSGKNRIVWYKNESDQALPDEQ